MGGSLLAAAAAAVDLEVATTLFYNDGIIELRCLRLIYSV